MKSLWRPGRTPPIEQSDSLFLLSLRFEGLPLGRQAVLANPSGSRQCAPTQIKDLEFWFFGTFRGAAQAFRVRGFGSNLRLGSAVLARRPRKVSRRKAQGSGFKGSGFRLFKVQSAEGLGFGV